MKWHAKLFQHLECFVIVAGTCYKRDIHSLDDGVFVRIQFRKNQLLGQSKAVIPVAIKCSPFQATKVSNTWQDQRDQSVEKLVHAGSPESYLATDCHSLTESEASHRITRERDNRFLTGDFCHCIDSHFQVFFLLCRRTNAHVDDDLFQPRQRKQVLAPQRRTQSRADVGDVLFLKSRGHDCGPVCITTGGLFLCLDWRAGCFHQAQGNATFLAEPFLVTVCC